MLANLDDDDDLALPNGTADTIRVNDSCAVPNATAPPACVLYDRRVYSASTRALLRGFVSAHLEQGGWMRVVRPLLTGDMLRLNGSILTLTLPATPDFDLYSPELISLIIPPSAVVSGRGITVNGTAPIAALGGRVAVGGSLIASPLEEAVRSPTHYDVRLTLAD